MWTGGHRHGRRPLRRAAAVGLAASIAAAACTSSAPQSGTSLVRGYGTILGLAPLKPGAELGLLLLAPENRSRSPLTISSVRLVGRGVGTVITVVHVKIAPDETENNSAPGGAYEVSAPEAWWPPAASCGRQPLVPLHGFRLAPKALARVWIVIRAAEPGKFHVGAHLVRYRQDGISYQQLIPTGYEGSVSRTAPFIPIDKEQVRCMKSEHVRPLPGHYVHKPKNYN
jgi:hypothetical protein